MNIFVFRFIRIRNLVNSLAFLNLLYVHWEFDNFHYNCIHIINKIKSLESCMLNYIIPTSILYNILHAICSSISRGYCSHCLTDLGQAQSAVSSLCPFIARMIVPLICSQALPCHSAKAASGLCLCLQEVCHRLLLCGSASDQPNHFSYPPIHEP